MPFVELVRMSTSSGAAVGVQRVRIAGVNVIGISPLFLLESR